MSERHRGPRCRRRRYLEGELELRHGLADELVMCQYPPRLHDAHDRRLRLHRGRQWENKSMRVVLIAHGDSYRVATTLERAVPGLVAFTFL